MFVRRDASEEELVESVRCLVDVPGEPAEPGVATPLGLRLTDPPQTTPSDGPGLVPLLDEEFLSVFDEMVVRYKALQDAYERGMVVAASPEQEAQLAEWRALLDD